jgi:outer membrane protein assembly factor BamB
MLRMGMGLFLALVVLSPALAQLPAGPGDWPAWRGPDRTGLSTETGLLKEWPAMGPKLLWKATGLGNGFSTPSVAGGRLFVLGTEGKEERLIAVNVADGKQLWATPIGTMAGGHPGPRSTPTVDGDVLYVISSDGKLVCADAGKGTVHWRKDLKADFGGKSGGWAYAESPLIDGDVLVCTPGGETATLVALNKKTGELIWKAPVTGLQGGRRSYATAAYSSVIVAAVAGERQYIQFLSGGVVGIAAKEGKLRWHYDKPANGTANCSTPIFRDDAVFAASAYGNGGGLARLTRDGTEFKAEEAYFIKQMQNHHGGMILVGDHVYGSGSAALLCVNFKTGEIVWQERSVGKGSVAYADGHLYVRSEGGPVALVEATPTGYKEKGRFTQPDRSSQKSWPHPVIAGGKLFLRDWDILLCYDVKAN